MKISEIIKNARDEYLWDGTGYNNNSMFTHKFSDPLGAIQYYLYVTFDKNPEEMDVYSDIVRGYYNVAPRHEDTHLTKEQILDFFEKKYNVMDHQNIRYMFMTLLAILAEEQGL